MAVWTPSQAVEEVGRQRWKGGGRSNRPPERANTVPCWVIGSIALSRNQAGSMHCHGQVLTNTAPVRGMGWDGMGWGKTWLVDLQRNQDVKKHGVADRGLAAVCRVDLEKRSDDETFSIHSLAFMIHHEAARRASVSHLLWLKERASKMCSSALVRTSENQETECVYIM